MREFDFADCDVTVLSIRDDGAFRNGVRIRHRPSGAIGECIAFQYEQNKEIALQQLQNSAEFTEWLVS